jgi:hypothetical protein
MKILHLKLKLNKYKIVVKLSVELGYNFLSLRFEVINSKTASMSSALLSVLLVCNRTCTMQ